MTNQHPITPPPELLQQWNNLPISTEEVIAIAWRHGADQELEACLEWAKRYDIEQWSYSESLRAARRPKPPSLKEKALGALSRADKDALTNPLTGDAVALRTILNKDQADIIRRALEQLDD